MAHQLGLLPLDQSPDDPVAFYLIPRSCNVEIEQQNGDNIEEQAKQSNFFVNIGVNQMHVYPHLLPDEIMINHKAHNLKFHITFF